MHSDVKLGLHTKYGGYALVSGAARGIGRAYAAHLAADGFGMLLVDREVEETRQLAEALRNEHDVDAHALTCDLSEPGLEETSGDGRSNTTSGSSSTTLASRRSTRFSTSLSKHTSRHSTSTVAPRWFCRTSSVVDACSRTWRIVIMSSASALSGSPYACHYAGPPKGYGLNLASGLWAELRGTGVDVLAVCPGLTDTQTLRDHGLAHDLPFYMPLTGAEPVALQSLRALGKQPVVVPAFADRLSAGLMSRLMPRGWTLSLIKAFV